MEDERPELDSHPKLARLVRMLGMPKLYAKAHLRRMWRHGQETGDPMLGDEIDVELAAEWEISQRPSGQWFKACLECRWIDEVTGGDGVKRYLVHDLHENAPEATSGRARFERERKKEKYCEWCGDGYHSRNTSSRFCSNSCRQQEYKYRKVTRGDAKSDASGDAKREVTCTLSPCTLHPAPVTQHPAPSTPDGPSAAGDSLRSILQNAGVVDPWLSRCSDIPGLTPIAALLEAEAIGKVAKTNPGAMLSKRLTAAGYRPIRSVPPKELARLVNSRLIESICGHSLHPEAPAKFYDGRNGGHCITFIDADGNPQKIAATELKAESIKIRTTTAEEK